MSEYFDTSARFTSAVNRINDRLKTMAKRMGTESKLYKDMVNEVFMNIPQTHLKYSDLTINKATVKNVLQIAKPVSLYKDTDTHKLINAMDKGGVRTWGSYREEYQTRYEQALKNTGENFTIEQFINVEEALPSTIPLVSSQNLDMDVATNKKALDIMKQSHKTYEELDTVIKLMGG